MVIMTLLLQKELWRRSIRNEAHAQVVGNPPVAVAIEDDVVGISAAREAVIGLAAKAGEEIVRQAAHIVLANARPIRRRSRAVRQRATQWRVRIARADHRPFLIDGERRLWVILGARGETQHS